MGEDGSQRPAEGVLFAGEAWFEPIEAGLRGRIRGLIEELVEQELEAALGRWRYQRGGAAGHRHGHRVRRLPFVAVPRPLRAGGDRGASRPASWRGRQHPGMAQRRAAARRPRTRQAKAQFAVLFGQRFTKALA
jgi:hypothetical protein